MHVAFKSLGYFLGGLLCLLMAPVLSLLPLLGLAYLYKGLSALLGS